MKRFLALLMAMVMVFALAACGEDTAENGSSDVSTTTSDTATNESTDDNESSTTSGEAQSSETESSKDSSTATTSKQQSTDKPATSSKDSTTSSKPSTSTSKPTTTTSKPTTSSTPSTSKPTTPSKPEIDYMTTDKIDNKKWTYSQFKEDVTEYISNNYESASMGIDSSVGKFYGEWYLCEEDTFSNFNIMGYSCYNDSLADYIGRDQSRISYIGAGYQMSFDTGKKTKTAFDVCQRYYEFACKTESFALECIERDINKLCEFSGVSKENIKTTNHQLNQNTYSDVVGGNKTLSITFFSNSVGANDLCMTGNDYDSVRASISCETREGVLYYLLTVNVQ